MERIGDRKCREKKPELYIRRPPNYCVKGKNIMKCFEFYSLNIK